MARKAGGRSVARAAAAESGEGLLAGLVDRVFEDPARSGGLMVVAMTATAIVCNAMFLQNAHRPAPLFQMRPSANSAPVTVPLPKPAPDFPAAPAAQPVQRVAPPQTIAPPLPRPSPAAKSAPVAAAPAVAQPTPAQQQAALVTEIQRGLARLGIYTGAIDGKTGGRTSAAIAKYEEAAGLKATGQPTPELLYALQHPTAAPANAARAPDPIAAELDQSAQRRAATIAAQTDAANARAAAAAQAQAEATQAAQAKAAAAQQAAQQAAKAAEQNKAAGSYRTVQTALNRIGYGPVPVDGTANAATVDAIRGFELDNGLPVTGAPSQPLIDRLVTIGAIKPN